jgi:phage gp45-like
MKDIDREIDSRANLRIAMDFLCDRIKEATNITPGCNSIKINYDTIYIENDILRVNVNAQQIAYGIGFMNVETVNGNGLMKVTLKSNTEDIVTFVCKRK